MLVVPESLRSELKDPLGPVYTDVEELLAHADTPLVSVGDIVTYHVRRAGRTPDLAVYDERTEREPVGDEIVDGLGEADRTVGNPAGELTESLLEAIREGVDAAEPVRVRVEGEEDLAALPAIVAAPDGASVVYGQPGEGMVHVAVTAEVRARARELLGRMDGDTDRALAILSS